MVRFLRETLRRRISSSARAGNNPMFDGREYAAIVVIPASFRVVSVPSVV
jgi:hypothetical protein